MAHTTMSQIIQASADRMHWVTVFVQSNQGFVNISDDTGTHEDIFLQGDDASAFISNRESLWNSTGDLDRGTIERHLAESYVDNLWN